MSYCECKMIRSSLVELRDGIYHCRQCNEQIKCEVSDCEQPAAIYEFPFYVCSKHLQDAKEQKLKLRPRE